MNISEYANCASKYLILAMRIGGKSKWPTLNYMAKVLVVYDGMDGITIPLRLLPLLEHLQW